MPSIAAFVKLRAKDQTSRVFDKLARRAERMEKRTTKSFRKMSRSAGGFKSIMGGVFGGNLLTRGTQLLTQGLVTAGREFVDFDQALTVASAKFPEKIKRGTAAFKELQDAARKVGAETQFTATQSAEGLALFAAAGIDAKRSIASLSGVVDLATATSVEFADATETALSTMGQFGLKAEGATKFAANLGRVSDALVFTINNAQIQMEDLSETLKFVGPIANTAGAEIEEVNAIIAAMAESGIKGSLAGTALKNMYLRLLDPSKAVGKELEKLQINIDHDNDGMIDMTNIIGQLEKSMAGMDKKTQAASLSILFGKRAVAGAAAAMQIGADKISKFEEKMRAAGGTSKRTADDIRKGLGNQLKILESTAIEAGFRLLEDFAGNGEEGIQKLTEAIRKLDLHPIVKGLKDVASLTGEVTTELERTAGVLGIFREFGIIVSNSSSGLIDFKKIVFGYSKGITNFVLGPLVQIKEAIDKYTDSVKKANQQSQTLLSAQQLTKNLQAVSDAQSRINKALTTGDVNTAVRETSKLAFELQKAKKNQERLGESTDATTAALKRAVEQMARLKNLQLLASSESIFQGAGPNVTDDLLPSVFTGEGFSAPNAAEASAKGGNSSLDVNFNNAPAGTTSKTKQGKGAPTVNSNLAGANP